MTSNEPENNQQQENEPQQELNNGQEAEQENKPEAEKKKKADFYTGLAFGIGVMLTLTTVIIPIALIIFAYIEGKGKPEVLKGFVFGILSGIVVFIGACFLIFGNNSNI